MKNKTANTTSDNGLLLRSLQSITQIYEYHHFKLIIIKVKDTVIKFVISLKFFTQLIL